MKQTSLNLVELMERFADEDKARVCFEKLRWPDGAACPRCGAPDPYQLKPTADGKTHVRKGVWKCSRCRKQFTVTIGTIMEDSHIPLHKWLIAFHLLCASKKGMSAHQLHRMLGLGYRAAWFMAREARGESQRPPKPRPQQGCRGLSGAARRERSLTPYQPRNRRKSPARH